MIARIQKLRHANFDVTKKESKRFRIGVAKLFFCSEGRVNQSQEQAKLIARINVVFISSSI